MIPAFIRPAAQRDIEAIAEYLVYKSGNLTLGDRFLTALSEALILLSKFPMLGRARRTSIAELTSVRSILLKRLSHAT